MDPESRATQLLDELGITALPINPFDLANKLDAPVKELDLGTACEGFLAVERTNALIGINSRIKSDKRKYFTVAHEVGHLCMDVEIGNPKRIECKTAEIGSYRKGLPEIEVRANRFASELLMPKQLVRDRIRNAEIGWDGIDALAGAAMVSRTAAAQKFIQHTEESCVLVVTQDRQLQWFRASDSFELLLNSESSRFMEQSIADRMFQELDPEEGFVEVPATTWVRSRTSQLRGAMIQEWSLPLNSYGQVLTILWDDTGIGENGHDEDVADDGGDTEKFDPNYGWETPTFSKKRRR